MPGLKAAAREATPVADSIDRYTPASGRSIFLLADGRMFNLAGIAPKGNSIESMDLGCMLQALSLERIAADGTSRPLGPARPPSDIERRIARTILAESDSAG